MGHVPPRPPPMPPCSQCGGSGYDDDSKSGALCSRGCKPPNWVDAGRILREGVLHARRRWWHSISARLSCWIRLGHRRVTFDIGGCTCSHCGARWSE